MYTITITVDEDMSEEGAKELAALLNNEEFSIESYLPEEGTVSYDVSSLDLSMTGTDNNSKIEQLESLLPDLGVLHADLMGHHMVSAAGTVAAVLDILEN